MAKKAWSYVVVSSTSNSEFTVLKVQASNKYSQRFEVYNMEKHVISWPRFTTKGKGEMATDDLKMLFNVSCQ